MCVNYSFMGMPFWINNALYLLSKVMTIVIFDHHDRFVVNYMYDTLIYSECSLADHLEHVRLVMQKLRSA